MPCGIALTFSAVWPTEPPAGMPEKRPLATSLGAVADQWRELVEHQHHGHAAEETGHHRMRHEARQATEAQQAEDEEHQADNDEQQEQRLSAVGRGIGRDGLRRGECGGAGGGDLHQLRTHQQAAAQGRGHAGVETVDGIDACQGR